MVIFLVKMAIIVYTSYVISGDVMVSTGILKIWIAIRRGDFVKKPTFKKETTIIITHLRLN